jgi:hypothetical protein
MRPSRVRYAPVVAVAVLAISTAACSDDDDPTVAASTSTAVVTTEAVETTLGATTSTAPPTTTPPSTAPTPTVPATSAPATTPLSIAPGDWAAILTELSRRRVALYAAPDLSRIGEYCMPATNCADNLQAQFGDMINRGEHVEGQQPFTVINVEKVLEGQPGPGGAVTQVVFTIGPTASPAPRIVNSNGDVDEVLTGPTTNTRGVFTLARWDADPALPWRVVLAEDLGKT